MVKRYLFHCILFMILLSACAPENTSIIGMAYHNTTAHYNSYYYANLDLRKVQQTIQSSLTDDYNYVLKLYAPLDTSLEKSYDDQIQEAVKMASLSIQRHPHSKWVDDSYILVGRARLYSLDWGNAIQTFKYVNTQSKNKSTRHDALLWLVHTFIQHGELDNAQAATEYLDKEKLNKTNQKRLYLEKAYLYQVRGDLDNMVRNLILAVPLLKKSDRPGRIYFIIGQVYQQLGFESEAFNYYKKCLSTNPEYEVDFYARLNSAQVAEISRSRDISSARKSFRKLLKDPKNKEFRDKIYYEMGVFELKQENPDIAIKDFNLAIREGSNKRVDGESYLRLGEYYFERAKKYELSQAYYDSAILALPKDYENYDAIQERADILNDFVKDLNTIQWQDSLLSLANLDSATIYASVKAEVEKNTPPPSKKKKKKGLIAIQSVNNSFATPTDNSSGTSDWYFGNISAIASGETDFQRIWGKRPLEDNWRRSVKSNAGPVPGQTPVATSDTTQTTSDSNNATAAVDPVPAAYENLVQQIPRTDEAQAAALKQIEDAYFGLGDIYYFKLLEKDNAASSYEKLLDRFPKSDKVPEVLYKLYLIYKDSDSTKAELYGSRLKNEYPETSFAKVLINPNYLRESSLAAEKQKELYAQAYAAFQEEDMVRARNLLDQAQKLGDSYFTPNLDLLAILITGKTQDITAYQYQLEQFVKQNADSVTTAYAQDLLTASRNFQLQAEKEKGINYATYYDEPTYFVISYETNDALSNKLTTIIDAFNKSYTASQGLNTSNIVFNDNLSLTLVSEFEGKKDAMRYFKEIGNFLAGQADLKNLKIDKFVATKDNFNTLYRTKGLDEYLRFFDQNYATENP